LSAIQPQKSEPSGAAIPEKSRIAPDCPRRSLWLSQCGVDQPVPNSMVRGLPVNQAIFRCQ
jgi:hypothetical protein